MKKIYLAGGWFTPEQEEQHSRIYEWLKQYHQFKIYNPRLEGGDTKIGKDSDKFATVLKHNILNICQSDIVVALMDFRDTGTIWETGFAYAKHIPIIYVYEDLSKPVNLMLAKTGYSVRNFGELIHLLNDDNTYGWKLVYNFEGDIE